MTDYCIMNGYQEFYDGEKMSKNINTAKIYTDKLKAEVQAEKLNGGWWTYPAYKVIKYGTR